MFAESCKHPIKHETGSGSSRRAYILPQIFSTRDLRDASAGRRKTLPHDRYVAEFYR